MSHLHLEAVERFATAPATALGDIGESLSDKHALEKCRNKKILPIIVSIIRYLARQALPLRGNWNAETMTEENSNLHQLLKLRCEENPEILEWLRRKR